MAINGKVSLLASAVLMAALLSVSGAAKAGPDIDGAVDALVDTVFDTTGSALGTVGLMASSIVGVVGDGVELLDDNQYSGIVLRGLFSTLIQRTSLATSNMFTGAMEGFRAEDLANYPESAASHLEPDGVSGRVDAFAAGFGGIYVTLSDVIGNPILFFLRGSGVGPADSVSNWQNNVRDRYFGPLADGAN